MLLGGLAYAGIRAGKAAMNVEVRLLPRLRKLNFQGIELDFDAELTNHRGGTFKVLQPRIRAFFRDHLLIDLDLSDKQITVPPHSTIALSDADQLGGPLRIVLPLAGLLGLVPDLVGAMSGILAGEETGLTVTFSGRFQAPNFPTVPFDITQGIELQSPIA